MENLFAFLVVLVVFIILFFVFGGYARGTRRKTVFVVKEKGTLTHGYVNDGYGNTWTEFMVYTRDGRSFKNVNSLWYWKWCSTELQAKLQKGKNILRSFMGGV